jgi:hypothetical protein
MAHSESPPSDAGQEGHFPGPPGQPPAAATPPAKLRPARAWFWVALVVFLAGAGWLGGGLYLLVERVDSFQRVALPGEGEVSLDHSGGYVIYYEGPGADAGNIPDFTVNVTPRSASAAVQGLEPYESSLTYSFGSREGRAVLTLQVASPGTFQIEATDAPATSGDSSLAIGSSIAGRIVGIVVPSALLMVVAVGGAIAIAIVRHRRRRSLRETGGWRKGGPMTDYPPPPSGGYPPPPPPPPVPGPPEQEPERGWLQRNKILVVYVAGLAVAIGVGVAVAGGDDGDTQTASESETTEPNPETTEPDPETTDAPAEPGPTSVEDQTLTEETSAEERWLDKIAAVRTEIDDAFLSSDPELTASVMIELETALRTCSRELAATGPPTARLQPAYILVEQACQAYDKGAECFATAAEIGIPEADTAEDRIFTDALDCGFDAQGSGGELLADAEIKGFEISGVHSDEG